MEFIAELLIEFYYTIHKHVAKNVLSDEKSSFFSKVIVIGLLAIPSIPTIVILLIFGRKAWLEGDKNSIILYIFIGTLLLGALISIVLEMKEKASKKFD